MYGVDLYGLVRRMVMGDGVSHREAARRLGIDRGTVAKMVKHPVPPGYQRTIPVRRPKLAEHVDFIEQVLDADETAPAKQRHTARRIFERERIIYAIEVALLEGATRLDITHFETAFGMQEGCVPGDNVFSSPRWSQIDLDALGRA